MSYENKVVSYENISRRYFFYFMALRNYLSALRLNFLENLSATPSVIIVFSKKRSTMPDTNETLLGNTRFVHKLCTDSSV